VTPDAASLARLRDIVEPAPVAWWPPPPGTWFVLALILIWTAVGLALLWGRWRRSAYRRDGLRALAALRPGLRGSDTRPEALLELAVLLKRVALTAFPRADVASLTGDAWLAFLQRTGGTAFGRKPASQLPACTYSGAAARSLSRAESEAIADAARAWIRTHRPPADR
jgi:hypothetical protein